MSAWMRLWDRPAPRWRPDPKPASALPPPRLATTPRPEAPPSRLLLINQYYWPDHASTAQHLTDLAESLADRGYECHVLCSRNGYREGRAQWPVAEERHGVQIHRVGATAFGRRSTLARMADYLSFYARAALHGLALRRFDVVAPLATPPIIGLVGTLLRMFKGSRHVYWSMDLHPDAS